MDSIYYIFIFIIFTIIIVIIITALAIKEEYTEIISLRERDIAYEERMYDMELKFLNAYKQYNTYKQ